MDGRDPWIGHSIEPDRASHVSVLSPMFLFPSSYLADSGRSHMDIKTMIDANPPIAMPDVPPMAGEQS